MDSDSILNCSHDEIMEKAQTPVSGYIEIGEKDVHITIADRKSPFKKTVEKVEGLPDITLGSTIVLPCLSQAALGEGNPTHKARFHLVTYLAARFRWFYPVAAIGDKEKAEHVELICRIIEEQGWVDYNARVTREQVENIVFGGAGNNGYSAASCATLEYDGLCVGKCRYFDGSIGGNNE